MGRRSDFPRFERDAYYTPYDAVAPLIPFLRRKKIRTFAEPCCGGGDLVRHLESYGLHCVYQNDIAHGRDALVRDNFGRADVIVTNPPHTRPLMHELIEHFQAIAPTWLLIDLEWIATLQAVPFLPRCSDVVIIGRVKWIEDSAFTSKDSFAWYRFSSIHTGSTRIHNTRGAPNV